MTQSNKQKFSCKPGDIVLRKLEEDSIYPKKYYMKAVLILANINGAETRYQFSNKWYLLPYEIELRIHNGAWLLLYDVF